MARIDILAPVEVVSFTKTRTRPSRRAIASYITKWGGPSRFDFSPQASDLTGPEVVPADDDYDNGGDRGMEAYWGNGEKVWTGFEVFRNASMTLTGEAGMPIDAEGIRTATFDCGERTIIREEKRLVGNTTVIYPTIEHCREYVELELALTTVLSRGTQPPPDTPPPPIPQEIEEAPIIEEDYDWGEPAFAGEAVVPVIPNTPQEVVELGAFRTPVRFAAGEPVVVFAYLWAWGHPHQGGGGGSVIIKSPDVGPINYQDGNVIRRYRPSGATSYEEVLGFFLETRGTGQAPDAPDRYERYGVSAWAIKPRALQKALAESGDTGNVVRIELWGHGMFKTGGTTTTTHYRTGQRVMTRSNPTATGNEVYQAIAESLIETGTNNAAAYFDDQDVLSAYAYSQEEFYGLYRPIIARKEWSAVGERIVSAEFEPPLNKSETSILMQAYDLDLTTLVFTPV